MNRVTLVGRLVRDPELRYTAEGIAWARMTVAVDRPGGKDAGADFVPVQAWRKLAETVAEHLRKGRLVAVDGRLRIDHYEKDGERRYAAYVVAEHVQFLDRPRQEKTTEDTGWPDPLGAPAAGRAERKTAYA